MPTQRSQGKGNKGTALVTGSSSGIGQSFAERFARDGFDVILVARRRERLEALSRRLNEAHGVDARVLVADLTEPEQLRSVETAIDECESLEYLVNNAGVAGYRPFIDLPIDEAESLVRLHVLATTRLTRAALPGMARRRHGVIINLSSGLAFSASIPAPPLPHRVVYASSKSYINTFSELLASEMRDTGVQVQALCPGIVKTELHDALGYDVSHLPIAFEPEDIVSASLAALALNEVICVPSLGDTGVLEAMADNRTKVMQSVGGGTIADRYKSGTTRG